MTTERKSRSNKHVAVVVFITTVLFFTIMGAAGTVSATNPTESLTDASSVFMQAEGADEDDSVGTNSLQGTSPTRLEEVGSVRDVLYAGSADSPNTVSLDLRAVTGDGSFYDLTQPGIDSSQFNVTVDGVTIDSQNVTIGRPTFINDKWITLKIDLPTTAAGAGSITIEFTTENNGESQTTEPLTKSLQFGQDTFSISGEQYADNCFADRRLIPDDVSCVTTGNDITITTTITNNGPTTDTRTVGLQIPGLDGADQSREVTLDSGESTTETFTVATTSGDGGAYTARVGTESRKHTRSYILREPADIRVVAISQRDQLELGENGQAEIRIANLGDETGTETLTYGFDANEDLGFDGFSNSTEVTLGGRQSTVVTLTTPSYNGDDIEYRTTDFSTYVTTSQDRWENKTTLVIPDKPTRSGKFTLDVIREKSSIASDESAEVEVRVTNTEDETAVGEISYELGSDGYGFPGSQTKKQLTLAGGESKTITLRTTAYSGVGDFGQHTYDDSTSETTISGGGSSIRSSVTLTAPNPGYGSSSANFQLEVLAQENPIDRETEHNNIDGSVKVRVTNIGEQKGEQSIIYDFFESGGGPNFGPLYYGGGETIELGPGESDIITLTMEFVDLNERLTGTATVSSDDDSIATDVEVIP